MVMLAVAVTAGHPPEAAIVFVTVYVPTVLEARFTKPLEALMLNPEGLAVNVPATPPPLNAGEGLVPLWQYGDAT
jgi:hypothetical protein